MRLAAWSASASKRPFSAYVRSLNVCVPQKFFSFGLDRFAACASRFFLQSAPKQADYKLRRRARIFPAVFYLLVSEALQTSAFRCSGFFSLSSVADIRGRRVTLNFYFINFLVCRRRCSLTHSLDVFIFFRSDFALVKFFKEF